MEPVVRTIHGANLQTCQFMKRPFKLYPNSTLNQKLNINADFVLAENDMPGMYLAVIGNGGHTFTTADDGFPAIEPIPHYPKHGGLYNQLPFILRPIENDLTSPERARYRLRRIEEHNGAYYAAYYAMVLDYSDTQTQMELVEIDNGNIVTEPYTPTIADLNPVAPALDPGALTTVSGNYLRVTAKVPFSMDAWMMNEFTEAINIIYGNQKRGMITEVGLCSGIDRIVPGLFNGVTVSYTDAVAVQIVNHISVLYTTLFHNAGFNTILDVGSVEPLLK